MENKNCPACGGQMIYREGISKAGKPYKMFKCKDCRAVEWVRSQTQYNAPGGASGPKLDNQAIEGLRQIYAVLIEIRDLLKKEDITSVLNEINTENL